MPTRLLNARKAAGLTQQQVAAHLGVNRSAISHLESGRMAGLSLERLDLLCDLLSVDMGWLVSGAQPHRPLPDGAEALLAAWTRLPREGRVELRNYAQYLAEKYEMG